MELKKKKGFKTVSPWASWLNRRIIPARKNEGNGYMLGQCILKMLVMMMMVMTRRQWWGGTVTIAVLTE